MAWKAPTLILAGMLLLSPLALAQDSGSPEATCDAEYDAALQEANERRDTATADAEADRNETYEDPDSDAEDRAKAEEDYTEAIAEANARYDDDVADAEADREECRAGDEDEDGRDDADADRDDSDDGRDDSDDDSDEEFEGAPPTSISGRHVTTQVTTFGLANYTVNGRVVFSEVTGPEAWDEYEWHGASHELEADDQEARIVDSAAGNLRFESEDTRAVPGPGLSFTDTGSKSGHGNTRFLLSGDGFTAYVNGDELYVENGTLYGEEFRLVVPQGRAQEIDDAIATGQIAAEVKINGGADATPLGAYNLTTEKSAGEVIVTIEGHGEGRTLLFDLEHKAIGPIEDLVVLFDGNRIEPADDLADVLNVTDGVAEYLILVGKNSTQVLVQVPHFSVHEIRLQGSAFEVLHQPPVLALAIGAVVATAFVAGSRVMRRS